MTRDKCKRLATMHVIADLARSPDLAFKKFAGMIAAKAFFAELHVSRALGRSRHESYANASRAQDEMYALVMAPDMPLVLTRFRR